MKIEAPFIIALMMVEGREGVWDLHDIIEVKHESIFRSLLIHERLTNWDSRLPNWILECEVRSSTQMVGKIASPLPFLQTKNLKFPSHDDCSSPDAQLTTWMQCHQLPLPKNSYNWQLQFKILNLDLLFTNRKHTTTMLPK